MFKITIRGNIKEVDNRLYLQCVDGNEFKATSSSDSPQGNFLWEVVPSIDPNGVIQSLQIEGFASEGEEECLMVGTVAQVRAKNSSVQLKIKRSLKKTLRLTLLSAPDAMKAGQHWQVSCIRQGKSFLISTAQQLEKNQDTPRSFSEPLPVTAGGVVRSVALEEKKAKYRSESEFLEVEKKAIASLAAKTNSAPDSWELNKRRVRGKIIEWDAFNTATKERSRIQLHPDREETKVWNFAPTPKTANISEEDKERLIVTPLGAARSIGASCFQVKIGPYEVVLDCGTRPKGYDPLPALDYLQNPDLLLVSHPHQDHIGAVPVFQAKWPATPIICTAGTREIAHVMLTDCLKVQQREDFPELFDRNDLERTLFKMETAPVGVDFEPLPGLTVRFINAGHILGAACIYLRYEERSLLYTGDFHTASSRTTTGLMLKDLPPADMLITESTYGAGTHPSRKAEETALIEAIASVVRAGGNVLIPAFALGRAQEIILAIRTSALFHSLQIPVYVDGLVRAICEVFRDNLDLLPGPVQNLVNQNGIEPFFDPLGSPPIIPIADRSDRPLAMAKPSVIIASSGMLTGGPSIYYAKTLLERENAAIFISGYTDEESPGRLLQNLSTGDEVELDGTKVTVRAQIRRFNLSAHADKIGLTQAIAKVAPRHLILIHGFGNSLHELADSGELKTKHFIHIPAVGDSVEYGSVPEHISQKQLTAIEMPNEFEITMEAEYDGAWLRVPQEVIDNDPRWQRLADMGILKAEWVGSKLLLKGVTQYSLQREVAMEKATASGDSCCANCAHFQEGCCQHPESSLFRLRVDPSGSCPDFASS